ncbi:MAG: cysteine--tRNA ligase [Euryarchaeota archaeon]|nr:cysteine--tRNA ligase [Euryarchaeota archaeon]
MALKVHNTASGELEEFRPAHGNRVHMYVCGPTVYDFCHIGHARSYVAFDTIRRYLEYKGYAVIYLQNFTDVDDKILKRARETGRDPREVSRFFIDAYFEDMGRLGVRRANFHPRVTDHIPEIIATVRDLVDKKHAYVADGDVFFCVTSMKDVVGRLSHQKLEDMLVGARVEPDEKKCDPIDFALWKRSKPGEPGWESPWGQGRPGWHIECSTMSTLYLGNTLDIHGGGMDLIFPHHESEIMQSEAHTGETFARYWLHNGFINVNKEKMSKSLGNFFTIREVLARYEPEVVRLFLVSTHYRSQIDFADTLLDEARTARARLRNAYDALGQARDSGDGAVGEETAKAIEASRTRFVAGMDDDFNTREAVASLFDLANFSNALLHKGGTSRGDREALLGAFRELGGVLGLLQDRPQDADIVGGLVRLLDEVRQEARARKDYATSDKIRDRLRELGVVVEDGAQGLRWKIQK